MPPVMAEAARVSQGLATVTRCGRRCGAVFGEQLKPVTAAVEPMPVRRSRSGENALERGLDPMGLCSICGRPFAGFDLQDDHVMPIGARVADEGLVLVRAGGEFSACLPSEAPAGSEVFAPVPCAALAHASCNMSKGATRDISRWRRQSLPSLVVAINESGERVALPPLEVLEPSPALDWTDAQREAYDRGVEALRRRGHRGARELRTIEELRVEKLRLEREHRRAAAEAEADEMIHKARAKLTAMTDWREVRDAITRITTRLAEAEAEWVALPMPPDSVGYFGAYFDGCFDHDAARAELRRWQATQQFARDRAVELYEDAVNAYKQSPVGRAEAARLAAMAPEKRVMSFNRHEAQAARTKHPADRARAAIARDSLEGLDVEIRTSLYHNGCYAKLQPQPSSAVTLEYLDDQGRVINAATGEILRTVKQPHGTSLKVPDTTPESTRMW